MKRTGPPTRAEALQKLEAREVGATLPDGPFLPRELAGGRWSIPAVGFLGRGPHPDVVLERDGKEWRVVKAPAGQHEEEDPMVLRLDQASLPPERP